MHDIVVIGAGPAGSEAAFRLASLGYSVLMLEKGKLDREKPCGGAIQTIELEQFGHPPDAVVEQRIRGAKLYDSKGNCMEVSFNPETISIRRSTYDTWLQDRARDKGAMIEEGSEVVGVKLGTPALVSVKGKADIKCRSVIDASGAWGILRRQFGSPTVPEGYCVSIQKWFHVSEAELGELLGGNFCTCFDSSIIPMGYAWIFPKNKAVVVGLGTTIAAMKDHKTDLRTALDSFVSNNPITGTSLQGAGGSLLQSAVIPTEIQSPLHYENSLVVGDAAGLANPIHGGGIYPARLSGRLAAEHMDEFLEKRRGSSLQGYDQAIKEVMWDSNYKWSLMMRDIFSEDELVTYLFENYSNDESFKGLLTDVMMRFDHQSAYERLNEIVMFFSGED
jgi:geranylgeranyl reductase family protein